MKTLPVGAGLITLGHPKGHAEFFRHLYPRPLIDNEVEAYSDELVKVNWEMCDPRAGMERFLQRSSWTELRAQLRVVQMCIRGQ